MTLTATAVALMISAAAPAAVSPPDPAPIDTAPSSPAALPQAETPPAATEAVAQDGAPVDGTTGDGAPATQGDDIVVIRRAPPPPGDPLERINVQSFKTVQAVDKAVLEPAARVYNKGIPGPVRQGLRNFFSNLTEPVVFAAYLLELKPGKAAETAGRFAINSTIGAAGLVDMAKRKPFNLPYRPNGLADVMGFYGVAPGPYMYLPIIGPTTLRDIVGDTVDRLLVPAVVGKPLTKPAVAIPATILAQLGERAAFDEQIGEIRDEANPYASYRALYLRQRKAEIDALHGRATPGVVPVYGRTIATPGTSEEAGKVVPK